MSEKKDFYAELIDRRDEAQLKLREREPELVALLTQLNAAIAGIEAESVRVIRQDEYSGFRKPNEAIKAYLERVQKPQIREEMCRAMVDGGYGRGTDRPYWDLISGINYQLKKKRVVERNGLIGKPEWSSDLFVKDE